MEHALTWNRLINQLDRRCQNRLVKYGVWVELTLGQQLNAPGIAIEYIYFPTCGVIALILQHALDKPLAIALIGNEGMLDIAPALGVQFVPYSAIVLAQGTALRISVEHLYALKLSNKNFGICLDRYIAVLNAQHAQAAVCNGLHNVQQRLARLLLAYSDRLQTSTLTITQELLATLLGVRRAGINNIASKLQQAKIVHYSRGHIEILNPLALLQKACYCYEMDKQTYESTMIAH
ncbi:Crp/Fnr family transcriptional regulator [Methylophilus sp. Leaf414]|uniref:Crp/Fnr family transcriptional regulator n=1 Tax=Methylophilus sp. Leaf414 TaxID=1736371 RepID=UPI0009EA9529|nr:Crp/Fnr family transcriptional regulator [Methylophilus sp. Leaf414]